MSTRAANEISTSPPDRHPDGALGTVMARLIRIAGDGDSTDLLREATNQITRLLGQRGSCILLDGKPRVALAPHNPEAADLPVNLARYPELIDAIERRQVVTIDDVRRDPRLDGVRQYLPADLRAIAAVPISRAQHCLGAFLVQSTAPTTVSARTRATAALLAEFTGLILSERLSRGAVAARLAAIPTSGPGGMPLLMATPPGGLTTGATVAPQRILVVEDDPNLRTALAESIGDEGYAVTTAASGEEGLTMALALQPDLILLDVTLPLFDGFEMARRLRDTSVTRTPPILFLSGVDDLPTRIRAARMDDIDFLRKPFSRDELFARIGRALQQAASRDKLRQQAQHDELTGLGNRRCLSVRMAAERARFERYGEQLAVVVFDLDKLKLINDQHGHLVGDATIKAVAEVLRSEGRETDLAVRYGGDEFVVLLPHTTGEEALVFATRTLNHVARLSLGGISLTLSAGVASLRAGTAEEAGEDVIRRADAAAYRAKRAGGNRALRDGDD